MTGAVIVSFSMIGGGDMGFITVSSALCVETECRMTWRYLENRVKCIRLESACVSHWAGMPSVDLENEYLRFLKGSKTRNN